MTPKTDFTFFSEATSGGTSATVWNFGSDSLTVQVSGTATAMSLTIEGKTDMKADFVPLACIDLTNASVASTITANGLYAVMGADGCKQFRAVLSSVTGGSVSVFGLEVNSAGSV